MFGALRSVRIEFTANEEVNEARQRHVAAVLDVFEVYLSTDNILVFANATVDCILCLLKYVHGPGKLYYVVFSDIFIILVRCIMFVFSNIFIILVRCIFVFSNIFIILVSCIMFEISNIFWSS